MDEGSDVARHATPLAAAATATPAPTVETNGDHAVQPSLPRARARTPYERQHWPLPQPRDPRRCGTRAHPHHARFCGCWRSRCVGVGRLHACSRRRPISYPYRARCRYMYYVR